MNLHNPPLVSVNVSTFNRSDLLPRCINSILAQSFIDFEIIVVDDCSSDQTKNVVFHFMENDARIKYIRHSSNRGLAVARNTALKSSRGKYIATIDDDDEWIDPFKLDKQVSIFLSLPPKNNLAIVCSSVRIFQSPTTFFEKHIYEPEHIRSKILSGNGFIYTSSVLLSHSILAQAGGFDEQMPKGIDSELYRRLILRYQCDVHFMTDITTAVHEYGVDRITSITSRTNKLKSIKGHALILQKYFIHFILHPKLFCLRLKSIFILIMLYLLQGVKIFFLNPDRSL